MCRAREVDQYPQAQPDGNRGREEENADQVASKLRKTDCPKVTSEYVRESV